MIYEAVTSANWIEMLSTLIFFFLTDKARWKCNVLLWAFLHYVIFTYSSYILEKIDCG